MFEWNAAYSVDVDGIDAQHKELFRLAEALRTAMLSGQGQASVGTTLDRLVDYTQTHFADEECLMLACGCTDYAAHKAEHEKLTAQVKRYQAQFRAGQKITIQVLQFLFDWMVAHIGQMDSKIAAFVRKVA